MPLSGKTLKNHHAECVIFVLTQKSSEVVSGVNYTKELWFVRILF